MSAPQYKSVATIAAMIPLVLVLSAVPAYADLCVPMVVFVWPASWLFLVFIVPIEIAVGLRVLPANWKTTVKTVVAANVVSTVAGIPLILLVAMIAGIAIRQALGLETGFGGADHWESLTLLQQLVVVVTQGPLLLSSDDKMGWSWIPLASTMVLCIPSFLVSVWLEYLVGRAFFSKEQWGSVRRWAWIANAFSYAFVLLVLGIRLLWITS